MNRPIISALILIIAVNLLAADYRRRERRGAVDAAERLLRRVPA